MKYIMTFLVLLTVYLLLAGFSCAELILGSLVSAVLSVLIGNTVHYTMDLTLPWRIIKFIVIYIPVFIYKLILANIDIARRVISPKIPLNPGIVKIKTSLKGDFGKLTLANSITLTPGTLSLDVCEDTLYVHAVDVKGSTEDEKKEISASFENILGGIFK